MAWREPRERAREGGREEEEGRKQRKGADAKGKLEEEEEGESHKHAIATQAWQFSLSPLQQSSGGRQVVCGGLGGERERVLMVFW